MLGIFIIYLSWSYEIPILSSVIFSISGIFMGLAETWLLSKFINYANSTD